VHISVFDIFKIGIGPSSSHTVGPMRAARRFAERLDEDGQLAQTASVKVELFGSLGFTGKGHGSDKAVLLGLEGEEPATVDVDSVAARVAAATADKRVRLLGKHSVALDPETQLVFHRRDKLPLHANGMRFTARDAAGGVVSERIYYSVGGGFVVDHAGAPADGSAPAERAQVPYPFNSAAGLRQDRHGLAFAELGASLVLEVDASPLRAARHELQWPAIGRHLVEHDQRLHEAAATIDVRPGSVAFVAMLDVLMPAEHDAVVRPLEVRLAQEMVHRVVGQQLGTWTRQARVTADVEQVVLAAAGPHDALNDLPIGPAAEDEIRSSVQRGFRQPACYALELVEARPHARHFIEAE